MDTSTAEGLYAEPRMDLLHDHLTFGFRRGCVACAQTEADLAAARKALQENSASRVML